MSEFVAPRLVTVAGPPSSGKTSLILSALRSEEGKRLRAGVIKFDCLNSIDGERYLEHGIPVLSGVAGNICPDHFYITNIEDCFQWAKESQLELLIVESAGLCNRCSPHLRGIMAVCVIDCLSGIDTPFKIGPMLKLADHVVLCKGDMVSQAEREVFRFRVLRANPRAQVTFVNALSGQGAERLAAAWNQAKPLDTLEGAQLRFTMPTAVCSYCLGETKVGKDRQIGIVRRMETGHAG